MEAGRDHSWSRRVEAREGEREGSAILFQGQGAGISVGRPMKERDSGSEQLALFC